MVTFISILLLVLAANTSVVSSQVLDDPNLVVVDDKPVHALGKSEQELEFQGHSVAHSKEGITIADLIKLSIVDDPLSDENENTPLQYESDATDPAEDSNSPSSLRQIRTEIDTIAIPDYVTKHAPVVYLYSEEKYMPYDIGDYVTHFDLHGKGEPVTEPHQRLKLEDLHNHAPGKRLFMTAVDEFAGDPDWITGIVDGQPDIATGRIASAPATVIVMDRGDGEVDAYWFYFYSFNEGPYVMGTGPFGNHLGDWEHSLVRFKNGEPQIVWMSAHGGGTAYRWHAIDKLDSDPNRPVIYAARGTHANYASVGQHSHDLPFYILSDFTDRGPLWDPAKNHLAYLYDGERVWCGNGSIAGREQKLGNWLSFIGRWGNQKLTPSDPRQHRHPFEWRFIDGPTGPLTKNLGRVQVCQRAKWWNVLQSCRIRSIVDRGEGYDAEGGNCIRILDSIKPEPLQLLFRLFTWRGWGCFFLDRIFG